MLRDRLRSVIAPRKGDDYELFNLSCGLFLVVLGTLLVGKPSPATSDALSWLLSSTPLPLWAIALCVVAVTAMACSYVTPALRAGQALVAGAAGVWAAVLLLGWVTSIDPHLSAGVAIAASALGLYAAVVLFVLTRASLWRCPVARRTLGVWTLRRSLHRASMLGLLVASLVLLWGAVGAPNQLTSVVIYGMLARGAAHQSAIHAARRDRRRRLLPPKSPVAGGGDGS